MIKRFESSRQHPDRLGRSTGVPAVDRLLPGGQLASGMLIEWISDGAGSGASLLPVVALKNLQHHGGVMVVVDRLGHFYPPAASAWGVDLQHVMVIRPTTEADELWAIDQALRSDGVTAVLAWPQRIDSFAFRRLQLAAESSGAMGLLVRPRRAISEPTWAAARLLVSPQPASDSNDWEEDELPDSWRLEVSVLRTRGGRVGQRVELQVDEQTGNINEVVQQHYARPRHLASALAHRASHEQTA